MSSFKAADAENDIHDFERIDRCIDRHFYLFTPTMFSHQINQVIHDKRLQHYLWCIHIHIGEVMRDYKIMCFPSREALLTRNHEKADAKCEFLIHGSGAEMYTLSAEAFQAAYIAHTLVNETKRGRGLGSVIKAITLQFILTKMSYPVVEIYNKSDCPGLSMRMNFNAAKWCGIPLACQYSDISGEGRTGTACP